MPKAQVQDSAIDNEDEDMMPSSDEGGEDGAMFENKADGLVVNLSSVEELKFDPIPAGTYDVVIEDNQFSMSKSSNKPMWNLKINVINGDYDGRKLFEILSFSEKALPGTKARLAVLAPNLLEGDFTVNDPETVASLIGKRASVKVAIGKGTDEYPDPRNVIKRWYQPTGEAAFG